MSSVFFLPSVFFVFSVCASHSDLFLAEGVDLEGQVVWFGAELSGFDCRFPTQSSQGETGEIFVHMASFVNGNGSFSVFEKCPGSSRRFSMDTHHFFRSSSAECYYMEDPPGRDSTMMMAVHPFSNKTCSGRMLLTPPFGGEIQDVLVHDITLEAATRMVGGACYVCRADDKSVDWIWLVLRCVNGKNLFVRLHIDYTDISNVTMSWGKAWCGTVRVEGQGKPCQSFNIDKTFASKVCEF